MKSIILLIFTIGTILTQLQARPGDAIFNSQIVHNLYIQFPYPNFYDSLLWSYNQDTYLSVDIIFDGQPLNQTGIKCKGNSSFNNPSQKKPFKLDFNRFISGQQLDGLKKLNLNNGFKDPSFMREKLANDFLINHQTPAPRTAYTKVYLNGQYWGLYVLVEEVDDEFCEYWFNNKNGNLFKGDPHGDLRWKGSATQSLYENSYELKNNQSINDWSDLIELIDIINNTPLSNLPLLLDAHLNTDDFLKQWACLNLFSSLDSYIGSGHNYLLYHNTLTDKFEWIAWDQNETFGSFKMSLTTNQLLDLDMRYLNSPMNRPLVQKMLASPVYLSKYEDAWCSLQQDFHLNYFNPRMDSLKMLIQGDVYSDTKKFYSNTAFDSSTDYHIIASGPGGLTLFGLRPFIQARQNAIQQDIIDYGISCQPLGINYQGMPPLDIQIFPNPAHNILHIQSVSPLQKVLCYRVDGRLQLNTEMLTGKTLEINISDWAPGTYFFLINGKGAYKLIH